MICWTVPFRPFRSWPGCKPLCPSKTADCWTEEGRVGRNAKTAADGGNVPVLDRHDLRVSRCWCPKEPNFSATSSNWKRPPPRRFAAGRCAGAANVGGYWRIRRDLRRRKETVKGRKSILSTDDAGDGRMDALTSATIIPNY